MKKTIEIIAVGQRKQGVSKKGFPFDFIEVSIMHDDKFGFSGKVGEIVCIDTAVIGNMTINPGDFLEVEMWTQNFKTKIGAIYG